MEDVSHQRNRRRCVGADAPTCSDFFPLGWPASLSILDREGGPTTSRAWGSGVAAAPPWWPSPRTRQGPGQDGRSRPEARSQPPGAARAGALSRNETRTSVRQGLGQRLPRPGGRRHFLRPEAPSAHPGVAPAALVSLSLSLPRANRGWRRPHSPCQGETAAATGERRESTNLHGHAPDARPCWRREAGSAD